MTELEEETLRSGVLKVVLQRMFDVMPGRRCEPCGSSAGHAGTIRNQAARVDSLPIAF